MSRCLGAILSHPMLGRDWSIQLPTTLVGKTIAARQEKGTQSVPGVFGTVVLHQHLILNILIIPWRGMKELRSRGPFERRYSMAQDRTLFTAG